MTADDTTTGSPRQSPLHERLAAIGACFGIHAGWEVPEHFGDAAGERDTAHAGVALVDRSGATHLLVQGPDAEALLQRLGAGDLAAAPTGSVALLPRADGDGETDERTVHRLAANAFLIVAGTGRADREMAWITGLAGPDALVFADDVTGGLALIELVGPRAAALLAEVGPNELSNRAFPPGNWRMLEVGSAPVRAARMAGPGPDRYQLAVPSDQAVGAFDTLMEAGAAFGLAPAGRAAWEALRRDGGDGDRLPGLDAGDATTLS